MAVEKKMIRAMLERKRTQIEYYDKKGDRTIRTVEPEEWQMRGGHIHVLAWCCTRDNYRSFALDSIKACHLTDNPQTHEPKEAK